MPFEPRSRRVVALATTGVDTNSNHMTCDSHHDGEQTLYPAVRGVRVLTHLHEPRSVYHKPAPGTNSHLEIRTHKQHQMMNLDAHTACRSPGHHAIMRGWIPALLPVATQRTSCTHRALIPERANLPDARVLCQSACARLCVGSKEFVRGTALEDGAVH